MEKIFLFKIIYNSHDMTAKDKKRNGNKNLVGIAIMYS